jgi:hypothetical protein
LEYLKGREVAKSAIAMFQRLDERTKAKEDSKRGRRLNFAKVERPRMSHFGKVDPRLLASTIASTNLIVLLVVFSIIVSARILPSPLTLHRRPRHIQDHIIPSNPPMT